VPPIQVVLEHIGAVQSRQSRSARSRRITAGIITAVYSV